MKHRRSTAEEIVNDPSLRWCAYRYGELVHSDAHAAQVRFVRYERGKIRVATLNGISNLPGLVDPLKVRRPSVMSYSDTKVLSEQDKGAIVAHQKLKRAKNV